MEDDTKIRLALLTIASVRAARKNGIKHFDQQGNLLQTDEAIIKAMLVGPLTLDASDYHPVTTMDDEINAIRKQPVED